MFSNDNKQTTTGAPMAQNPSMLDHVSQQNNEQPQHPVTAADPFAQSPAIAAPTTDDPSTASVSQSTVVTGTTSTAPPVPEPISSAPQSPDPNTPSASEPDTTSATQPAETTSTDAKTSSPLDDKTDHAASDNLSDMKKQALEHLEPLIAHLDQKPEEEFKTTMMMIQANDNHTLIEKALTAAKNIADDKERAQAMLDIINEINYFSQTSAN